MKHVVKHFIDSKAYKVSNNRFDVKHFIDSKAFKVSGDRFDINVE